MMFDDDLSDSEGDGDDTSSRMVKKGINDDEDDDWEEQDKRQAKGTVGTYSNNSQVDNIVLYA